MQHITISEKQTFSLAKKFAKKLKGGEIIGLIGDLGAGKTIFTKGLAKGLGIKKNITSPTFVLMKVYPVTNHKSQITNFIHVDAYRIKSPRDLTAIGLEEYLNRPDTVVVIEWADKIKKASLKKAKLIKITLKGTERRINIL